MVKLFVEGGGDASSLKSDCRKGFSTFLRNAGLAGKMPRIVASGGRQAAYDDYCTEVAQGNPALLLVDSECKVDDSCKHGNQNEWDPWLHLSNRDGDKWVKPQGGSNADCHLMVQCMELWFIVDSKALSSFYGQGFNSNALPGNTERENISKQDIYNALENATKAVKVKGKYGKAEHSFKLLEVIDPEKVTAASPWANRFVDTLKRRLWGT